MLTLRGETYHMNVAIGGARLRFSLGTRRRDPADRLSNRVKFAIADGPNSVVWPQLQKSLPQSSYKLLTRALNLPTETNLTAFQKTWEGHLDRRVSLGEITESSARLYRGTSLNFFNWMVEQEIQLMGKITPEIVGKYILFRTQALKAKGKSGRGIITEQTVISTIFDLAIGEGIIKSNPVKYRFKPDSDPIGAEPFTPEELSALLEATDDSNRLAFLILKHTGLRGSDVSELTWSSINWTEKTLVWKTKKRGVTVTVPLCEPLIEILDNAFRSCSNSPEEKILWMSHKSLYNLVRKLGEKAGVNKCYPHRFRDTFCVTLLSKGATIFDVAKLIGDKVATVESYYASVTPAIVERARKIMEDGLASGA